MRRTYRVMLSLCFVTAVLFSMSIAAQGGSSLPRMPENHIYFVDNNQDIFRMDLDGSNVALVVDQFSVVGMFSLAVDKAAGKVYWATANDFPIDMVGGNIFRANTDGTNPEHVLGGGPLIFGMDIDPARQHIWYSESDAFFGARGAESLGSIRRVNYDGTGELIIVNTTGISSHVSLDLINERVYWSEFVSAKQLSFSIQSARLDGSDVRKIAEGNLNLPYVGIDPVAGHLFWESQSFQKIVRADLDGTNRINLDIDILGGVPSVAGVDFGRRKLYILLNSPIGVTNMLARSDPDGSRDEVLASDLQRGNPLRVAFDTRSDLCRSFPGLLDQYDGLATAFDFPEDLDSDGLPEIASLKLFEAIACQYDLYENGPPTASNLAYDINLEIAIDEPQVELLGDFRESVAALAAIGSSTRDALVSHLSNQGVDLSGAYVFVTCNEAGICSPLSIRGLSFEKGFDVFDSSIRAINEPFSGLGDIDGDGVDNATEYANVIAQGGTLDDFVNAAINPSLTGAEALGGSGGGGGGCFIATAAYGTPLATEINVLRGVRDRYLLSSAAGSLFVDTYYRLSPPVAALVAEHAIAAWLVRLAIIPVVWLAGGSPAMLLLGAAAVWVGLGFWRRRRRVYSELI